MVWRGHEPALLPRIGAGESFVGFIALFGRPGVPEPSTIRAPFLCPTSVERVPRKEQLSDTIGQNDDAPRLPALQILPEGV